MMPHVMQQQVVLEAYALRSQAHKAIKHQLCEHIKQLEKALQHTRLELFHAREQLTRTQELADVARAHRERKRNMDALLTFYDTLLHNKQDDDEEEKLIDAVESVKEDWPVGKTTQDPEEDAAQTAEPSEESCATHKTVDSPDKHPPAPLSRSSFQELLNIQKQEAEDVKAGGIRWHQLALRQLSAERLRSASEPPTHVHSSTKSKLSPSESSKAPFSFRQLVAIRDATGSESGWHRAALRILAKQRKQLRLQVSCDHDGSNDKQPLSNTNSSASTLSFAYDSDSEI